MDDMANSVAATLWQKGLALLALIFMGVALTACSATFTNHGFVPPPEDLAQINIGDSRETVQEIVGTPMRPA